MFVGGLVSYRKIIAGNWCVFTSHIAVVSVATDTSVPSSTELDACSTQTPYCWPWDGQSLPILPHRLPAKAAGEAAAISIP